MIKILYTTSELRHPAISGPYLRVENSIKALNDISELHIISRSSKKNIGGNESEKFYKNLSNFFQYAPSLGIKKQKLKYKIKKLFFGKKSLEPNNIDARFIVQYSKKMGIDIIWFGYGNISYDLMKNVKNLAPDLKLICDTDSVWSRFILRGLPFAKDESIKQKIKIDGISKEQEEASWVEFCDVTTAVSEVDADYYRSIAKNPEKIKIFSNVIDLDTYKEKSSPPDNFKTPNIYFAGSFWPDCPMEISSRWIIKDVLPLVKKRIPNIHFYIIGNESDTILADIVDENITITGRLDSVLPYLCNANIAIVALKFESGTRFKILEAAACNIPLVSTTLGAEGIEVETGGNILIADEAQDFADAIIKLIQNPDFAQKIAQNLKIYVENNYSIEKHSKEALAILNYLLK